MSSVGAVYDRPFFAKFGKKPAVIDRGYKKLLVSD
jgi:hypothetical protein